MPALLDYFKHLCLFQSKSGIIFQPDKPSQPPQPFRRVVDEDINF